MKLTLTQIKELRRSPVRPGGNRVAKAMELSGETLTSIARTTGLNYAYVADVSYERYQDISVARARQFAGVFGVQIEDLWPAVAVAS